MNGLLGVIGDPIAHSLSPFIQNGWLRHYGIDATYAAMQVKKGELASALESLSAQRAHGLNITLPHKEDALLAAQEASPLARQIGAANTLIARPEGGWRADNTDAPGFALTLDGAVSDLAGRNVVLLGAGGAARAVAAALAPRGARLTVCNRTLSRAATLVSAIVPGAELVTLEDGLERLGAADLVINTLSAGHSGEVLALPPSGGGLFYDISYGAAAAGTLAAATAMGWQTRDGLGMLVAQAALSFELWFGERPDIDAAEQRARAIVEATA